MIVVMVMVMMMMMMIMMLNWAFGKPAHAVPLASARQHPENQKESQAGNSPLVGNYYFSNYLGDVVIYYFQLLLGEKLR